MRAIILGLLAVAFLVPLAFSQEPAPATAVPVVAAAANAEGPVAVPEPSELALQRYRSGNILWFVNQLWGLLIPCLFLFTGFSARLRTWAGGLGRYWFFIIALYFTAFSLINFVVDLPLSYYQGYVREHAYGLSNQTLQKWFQDGLINLLVGIIIGVLVLWIPYLLLKKSPKRWWLYTAILIPPFLFLQMFIQPIFIDPLFNDFGPMENKELEAKILALAERSGIEGSRVYEVDKSVDTNAVNAYVTGFMNTKRIVLWDTLLNKLDDDEVLFVMGHEMGHYVLGHVVRFIAFISIVLLGALYLIHRLAGGLLTRFAPRFGFNELADIASLPLIIVMFQVLSLGATPLILAVSRHHEHEADRFGVELTQLNHAAGTGFVKLQNENLAVPWHGLMYTLWRDSHPSIGKRITFFNEYKPWEQGKAGKYDKHFAAP